MDKETELQNILEENEMLKSEMKRREMEKVNAKVVAETEAARAAKQEANMKLGYMIEEAYKNNRRAVRVAKQLEAVQAASCEMKAELKRLNVRSDQWRKAAEAAATMLSTGSLDSSYNLATGKIGSPDSDDVVDDFMKKKNGNVLKKIGIDECDGDLHPVTRGGVEVEDGMGGAEEAELGLKLDELPCCARSVAVFFC
ncbi:hypothetical protein ACSBR1_041065 [Camellia fascicularis]